MPIRRAFGVLGAFALGLCAYLFLPESCPEAARRTAFVFVSAAVLWAFALLPLYATSLGVVLLLVFLLGKPGGVLGMDPGGYTAFLTPFSSPVIILFFGGFILAQAMQKYSVDRQVAHRLLRHFGDRPYFILMGFMLTTAFFSMWLSNTATTAMMIAMTAPLLGTISPGDPFRKALPLGIAFAANIGGLGTPVGTPPNAIALGNLAEHGVLLSFVDWMVMAVPLMVVLLGIAGGVVFLLFRPQHARMSIQMDPGPNLSRHGKWSVGIALLTVLLWLTSGFHRIPEAVVALLAAGLLTAGGLLDKDDLKRIDWDILVLMWGGLALGVGMQLSGLAQWVLRLPFFGHSGFVLVAVFASLAALLSTFISHTAAANLILPIAVSIAGENIAVLGIVVALSCSFGMVLPISTPPNAIAYSTQAFTPMDMVKSGLVLCMVSVLVVLLGYRVVLGWL